MQRNKRQIEEETKVMLSKGWKQKNIDEIGFCSGCGSFGFEDCDENCPELIKLQNDTEFQHQCLLEEVEETEKKAGWDATP